jgi:hypothetical protein
MAPFGENAGFSRSSSKKRSSRLCQNYYRTLLVRVALKEQRLIAKERRVVTIRVDGKRLLIVVAIVALVLGGVAVRAHTLADSSYPYILDGLVEARYAENIANTGALAPEAGSSYDQSHTASTPAFDIFIALSSLFQGEDPLYLLQKLIAPFAMLTLLGVYVLSRRLTGNVRVASMALMATAAYGPFMIVTQAAWKEAIGISLLPFILLTFFMRKDPKMRGVSTLLLLMIPFVHHLVALIAVLTVAIFSSSNFMLSRKNGKKDSGALLDVFVTIIVINVMVIYYCFMQFDRLDYLTPDKGLYLFLGLAILVSMGVYYIADKGMSALGRKIMVAATGAGLLSILAMNFLSPIGTIESNALWAVTLPMIAGIAIALLGICGISLWAATIGESKLFYFSMICSPFIVVIYALLRAEDLLSLDIITRTIDFFDIGLMMGLGTFVVFLLKGKSFLRTAVVTSAVCALLLLTIPFAIDSEKYAGTRNGIYAYEVDALNWTVEMTQGNNIDTDEHFAYADVLYDEEMQQTLVNRFVGTIDFQSDATMISSERWVTVGVKNQIYGWITLNRSVYDSVLDDSNVLYVGGPRGIQVSVFTAVSR